MTGLCISEKSIRHNCHDEKVLTGTPGFSRKTGCFFLQIGSCTRKRIASVILSPLVHYFAVFPGCCSENPEPLKFHSVKPKALPIFHTLISKRKT